MKWHERIVSIILGIVVFLSLGSIILYQHLDPVTQDNLLFALIVLSGWTSGAGLGTSLWLFWKYETTVEQPLKNLSDKSSSLVDDLSEGFLEEFVETLIQAEKRFASLPPEKQKRITRMIEKYSDSFLERVEKMPENPPEKKVNRAKSLSEE